MCLDPSAILARQCRFQNVLLFRPSGSLEQQEGFVSNTGRRDSRVFLCSKGQLGGKSTKFLKIALPH